jgi:hypothetical protein
MCVSPPFTTFWFASSPVLLENSPRDGDVTFAVVTGDDVAFARYGYCEVLGYRVSELNICGNRGDMLSPFIAERRDVCFGEGMRFCGKLLYIRLLSVTWLFIDAGLTRF